MSVERKRKALRAARGRIRRLGAEHRVIESELAYLERRKAELLVQSCRKLDGLDRARRIRDCLVAAIHEASSPAALPPVPPPVTGTVCESCGGEGVIDGLVYRDSVFVERCARCAGKGVLNVG